MMLVIESYNLYINKMKQKVKKYNNNNIREILKE